MNAKDKVLRKLQKSSVYSVTVMYSDYMKYQGRGVGLDEMIKQELCYGPNAKVPAVHLYWLNLGRSVPQETDKGTR
jgi:hypothetical protein